MARKDITDLQVCRAYLINRTLSVGARSVIDVLREMTGEPHKVCYRAMERTYARGFLDYGVSLRTAWLTEKAQALLETNRPGLPSS